MADVGKDQHDDKQRSATDPNIDRQRLTIPETIVENGPAVVLRARLAKNFPIDFITPNVSQFGYTPEDFASGRVTWESITHPEDMPRLMAELNQHIEEGISQFGASYRIFTRDGEVRWIEDRNQVIRDASGQPTHIDGMVWDVTDRKRVEQELQASESKYRTLFERVPVGLYRMSPDNRAIQSNPALISMLGYEGREDELTNVEATYVDPRQLRRWKELMETRGTVRDYEIQLRRADGKIIWARDTATAVRDEHGRTVYYEGILEDITEQKQAIEALSASEREKRAILDAPKEHMILMNRSLDIVWPNRAACESAGVDRQEIIGRKCYHIWGNRKTPCPDCPVLDAIAKGETREIEKRTPDGRGWYVRGYPLRDQNGEIIGAIEMTRDITDRLRGKAELRRSESMLSESQRMAHLGSWEWDAEKGVVLWSAEMYRIFGVDERSFTPTYDSFLKLIHPDDIERVRTAIEPFLQTQNPYDVEHRIVRPDGTLRIVHAHGRFYGNDRGRTARAVGTALDVTEQRRAEQALRESETKYRTLAENVTDIFYSVDAAGLFTYVGPQVARYGFAPADLVGKHFTEVILPEDHDRVAAEFRKTAETGQEFPSEMRIRDARGNIRWMEERGRALSDQAGRFTGLTGVLRDITDRKTAELEMQRHQQRLRQMALELSFAEERERKRLAALLHDDVAQLLIATKLKLAMLDDLDDPSARKTWAADVGRLMTRAIRSTRSLTSQLSHPALYDMGLAPAAEWLAEDMAELHGLDVLLDAPKKPDKLDLRVRVVLFQCIRELLVNVTKHAQTQEAAVRIDWDDRQIHVEVTDNGEGFDPRIIRHKSNNGHFGLFSIRERIEIFGGQMTIRSAPGQGTTVNLTLPIRTTATPPTGGADQ